MSKWGAIVCLVSLFYIQPLSAQSAFHVFPQVVDGAGAGLTYRSVLMITNSFDNISADCTLRLYGLQATFTTLGATIIGPANFVNMIVPAGGWHYLKTTGLQFMDTGYATLTCSSSVSAQLVYSLYSGSTKISEATVFASPATFNARFIADQTEGARLGVAIVNNNDVGRSYTVTVSNSFGVVIGTRVVFIPARTSHGQFIDELVANTGNQVCFVTVQALDFSGFSAIGLRFTGGIFTTVPAN